MKITVWTTVVDNYFPDLCALSLPNHEAYAKRIGADFRVISDRIYPEWHPTYEKVQIYELGKDSDWNIHIDADLLLAPTFDRREIFTRDTIHWYSIYDPGLYFACDQDFAEDGRRIGVCSSFLMVPKSCHALWTPFNIPYAEALKGINQPHGIDDYCFSKNFAKHHLPGEFIFTEDDDTSLVEHLGVGGVKVKDNWNEVIIYKAQQFLAQWKD